MILSKQRTVFSGAVTGQVTTVGTAATYTGLCLSNPNGSGVNLIVDRVGAAFAVAFPAAAVIGLMSGLSTTNVTHTTPVTPYNQFAGTAGLAKLDSAATLTGTPTLTHVLGAGLTGAITTTPSQPGGFVFEEGSLVIPPGGYVAIYTSTASGTAAGAFSFTWQEVLQAS